ncbi:hypothetical protein FRB90_001294 [Tulasnella sp. 427]|nr:hypothetical protein FRB90_001294 [Tulasnella sp. 427]
MCRSYVALGIPSTEKAAKIVGTLQAVAITHVAFKLDRSTISAKSSPSQWPTHHLPRKPSLGVKKSVRAAAGVDGVDDSKWERPMSREPVASSPSTRNSARPIHKVIPAASSYERVQQDGVQQFNMPKEKHTA